MKNIITLVLFIFMTGAMNAQSYKFSVSEKKFSGTNIPYYSVETEAVTLGSQSPDLSFQLYDENESNKLCGIDLIFLKVLGENEQSNALASIKRLVNSIPPGEKKVNKTILFKLSNEEILTGNAKLSVNEMQAIVNSKVNIGAIQADIPLASMISIEKPAGFKTFDNQKIICNRIRNYDIVEITIGDERFDVRGMKSAATFDAMFNALAKKTGKGGSYDITPQATIGNFYVAVLSSGEILCKLEDVTIEGAKDKEIKVNIMFENQSYGLDEFNKTIRPPYESTHYDHIIVKGNVRDLYYLRNKRGHYNVSAHICGNKRIENGHETIDEYGESRTRGITIYNDGSWQITGGGL